jgi:hypothetical protein
MAARPTRAEDEFVIIPRTADGRVVGEKRGGRARFVAGDGAAV